MISGRIERDIKGASISIETIYAYIYSKKARRFKLWEYLPYARKKRKKKTGRKVQNKGKVPNATSIGTRAKKINNRKVIGHWETDNVEGIRTSKPALYVTIERVSRFFVMSKMPNQTSVEKTKVLCAILICYPQSYI